MFKQLSLPDHIFSTSCLHTAPTTLIFANSHSNPAPITAQCLQCAAPSPLNPESARIQPVAAAVAPIGANAALQAILGVMDSATLREVFSAPATTASTPPRRLPPTAQARIPLLPNLSKSHICVRGAMGPPSEQMHSGSERPWRSIQRQCGPTPRPGSLSPWI